MVTKSQNGISHLARLIRRLPWILAGNKTVNSNFDQKSLNSRLAGIAGGGFLGMARRNPTTSSSRLFFDKVLRGCGASGLALCKSAHWMFDEGLWSVRNDGRVVLAPYRFTENGPEGLRLQPYAGRLLQFSDGVTLWPNSEYFTRHRAFHGFR